MTLQKQLQLLQASCDELYCCETSLSYYPQTNSVAIVSFRSREPGKGNGTLCLRYLLSMLKSMGIKSVTVQASPLGGMSAQRRQLLVLKLCNWYARFNFDMIQYNFCGRYISSGDLVWTPKSV